LGWGSESSISSVSAQTSASTRSGDASGLSGTNEHIGSYPDDLAAALQRADFLLYDILAELITPAAAKTETAQAPVSRKPASIQ
jgi:hypothetical protein